MNDDLISRDAVLDIDFHKLIHITTKPAEMIRQKIEQLPSVNPQEPSETIHGSTYGGVSWGGTYNPQEPKTGHWITARTIMHDGEFYCDKCDCDAPQNIRWNYCPNCGAKMQESEE